VVLSIPLNVIPETNRAD